MSVNGYLSDFPLPEIFQLLQDGKKTGLLSIQALTSPGKVQTYYFIWLHRGRIVTITNRLDSRGLAALINRRGYLGKATIERLIRRCPLDEPLGRFLQTQGVLTSKQLQILFAAQVIRQICALFQVPDAYFAFDPNAPLPKVEMTGLSAVATEVILPGLRLLKDWSAFQEKLPHPQSTLTSLIRGQPNVRINQAEWNIWRLVDENVSLNQIATNLGLPVDDVQRIAFRLIFVGLVQEVPRMLTESAELSPELSTFAGEGEEELSPKFFRNLIGFLRQAPKSS